MTLHKYLILMAMASIIFWSAWGLVVFYMNPAVGSLVVVLFYLSLFFAIISTFSVIGFILRSRLLRGELAFRQVAVAFRQAFWFGIIITISLWLQARDLFTWYNLVFLLLISAIFEFFFLSTKRNIHD